MRRRLGLITTCVIAVLLVAAPAAQAAPKTPFAGAWTSIDVDGSTQYLAVSGGTTVHVTWIDLYGSICANEGAPTTVFTGSLGGTVAEDTLTATWTRARCGPVSFGWLVGTTAEWTYDADDDVLYDGVLTWIRR
jgi:hypothetical protein